MMTMTMMMSRGHHVSCVLMVAAVMVVVAVTLVSAQEPGRGPAYEHMRFAAVGVPEYKADSGGCQPATIWEKQAKHKWWDWESRLPKLAEKVKGMSRDKRAATVLTALGDENMWLQIVDGWAHLKGPDAFGSEYVVDMKRSFAQCQNLLNTKGVSKDTFGEKFYTDIHFQAFKQTAHLLSKRNGYRGPNSGVYLPLPDKPLGVFHDIHEYGKMTYNPQLRRIDRNSGAPTKWKYNQGYLMRWVYPNMEFAFGKAKVEELFNQFWVEIGKIDSNKELSEGDQRDAKLTAVVWLYHSLENFHCFIDGNGRTNILVLDTLLSWVGLHPVSFYNSMESALASVDEMREKILEGYLKWEEAMRNIQDNKDFKSGWTLDAINIKNKECKVAIDALWGRGPAPDDGAGMPSMIPDTQGGCMCIDAKTCDSNEMFQNTQWCYTNSHCTWKWDFCAPGRRGASSSSSSHHHSNNKK